MPHIVGSSKNLSSRSQQFLHSVAESLVEVGCICGDCHLLQGCLAARSHAWYRGLLKSTKMYTFTHFLTCIWVLQAFADILASNEVFDAPMEETYSILGIDPNSVTTLESYLKEYFSSILRKLKEVGAQSKIKSKSDFYV